MGVLDAHKSYLAARDIATINLLMFFLLPPLAYWATHDFTRSAIYAAVLLAAYVACCVAAQVYGTRLVENVLARPRPARKPDYGRGAGPGGRARALRIFLQVRVRAAQLGGIFSQVGQSSCDPLRRATSSGLVMRKISVWVSALIVSSIGLTAPIEAFMRPGLRLRRGLDRGSGRNVSGGVLWNRHLRPVSRRRRDGPDNKAAWVRTDRRWRRQ